MYPVIFIIKKIHSNVYLKIKRELFCILLVRVVTCIIATFHTSVLTLFLFFLFIRQVKYCSVFILPLKYMSHVPTFPKYPYKSSLLKTISLIKFIATTSRKDSFTRMMVTKFSDFWETSFDHVMQTHHFFESLFIYYWIFFGQRVRQHRSRKSKLLPNTFMGLTNDGSL